MIKLDKNTKELLKHGKNYVSASILVKGLSVISIPILTKILLLDPSDFGLLSVFTSMVTMFAIIDGFGIRSVVQPFYYDDKFDFKTMFSSNAIFIWLSGIIISIISLLFRDLLAQKLNVPVNLIIFAITAGFFISSLDYSKAYLRTIKKSKLISRLAVIRAISVLTLTITITFQLNEYRYFGSIISQTSIGFLLFLFSIRVIRQSGFTKINKRYIKTAFVLGFPVMFHLLSGTILKYFDQIMINSIVGSTATGLYSFAYKVGMLFELVTSGLNQSWTPIMYEKLRDKNYKAINVTIKKYSFFVSLLALILVIISPYVVKILATPKYYTALPIVPIVITGFIFQYWYSIYVIYSFHAKKTKVLALITVISGALNIGLNAIFIPIYGYIAAAWTTLFTYLIYFLMHFVNVQTRIKPDQSIPLKYVMKPGIISIILIVIHLIQIELLQNLILSIGVDLILVGSYILMFYRYGRSKKTV